MTSAVREGLNAFAARLLADVAPCVPLATVPALRVATGAPAIHADASGAVGFAAWAVLANCLYLLHGERTARERALHITTLSSRGGEVTRELTPPFRHGYVTHTQTQPLRHAFHADCIPARSHIRPTRDVIRHPILDEPLRPAIEQELTLRSIAHAIAHGRCGGHVIGERDDVVAEHWGERHHSEGRGKQLEGHTRKLFSTLVATQCPKPSAAS